jgi:AcrR family transcriptional regulator
MAKTDRRKQRARKLLQKALIELMSEREYDALTIQDIVDRANLGRTTFYLHYHSKDELFMSCHETIIREFRIELLHPFSREELSSSEIPSGMISAFRHLEERRAILYPIFHSKDSQLILRQIRERSVRELKANLRAIFAEDDSSIPLDILANYWAGTQIALVQ